MKSLNHHNNGMTNYICNCGAHFYAKEKDDFGVSKIYTKPRWYSKEEWDKYIEDFSQDETVILNK